MAEADDGRSPAAGSHAGVAVQRSLVAARSVRRFRSPLELTALPGPAIELTAELTTVADDLAVFHEGAVDSPVRGVAARHRVRPARRRGAHTGAPARRAAGPSGDRQRCALRRDRVWGDRSAHRWSDRAPGPGRAALPGGHEPRRRSRGRSDRARRGRRQGRPVGRRPRARSGRRSRPAGVQPFGDRLHVVRGNHDAYQGQHRYAGDQWIELPGLTIGLLDTTIPQQTTAGCVTAQLAEVDDRLAATSRSCAADGAPSAMGATATRPRIAATTTSGCTPTPATPSTTCACAIAT